ncbi:hypothetical protein ONZ43_g4125 [Nemania bipapillata]|uniref:Uncharacterized protein n=1 Tax=Nemania bipapillata TaxID=110536 RepID=A0ACC2IRE7_9PEZI|nr:hypothetical protein ONZ43_g4125 [Nemania bipapillata]
MLFFDDESRNRDTETLGVTMWLVRDGVSWTEIESGIQEWRRRRARLNMFKMGKGNGVIGLVLEVLIWEHKDTAWQAQED